MNALLVALLVGLTAPAAPSLTEAEEARLAAGKVVVQQNLPPEREGGIRTRAIAEVSATPEAVWNALLDFQPRVAENAALKKVTTYEEVWAGDVLRRKARWDLSVVGTEIVFHNDYTYDRAASYLNWVLDETKDNDLVYSWGSYQVLPSPIHPGLSRLVYVSENESARKIPKWLRKELAESSMSKLINGIRKRAEQ
jgi:hypothetical protein